MKLENVKYEFKTKCPESVMEEAIREYKKSNMLGTLNFEHDAEPYIQIGHISHRIEDIKFDDGKLTFDVELLDTGDGKFLQSCVESGAELKFAPRMLCEYETDENGEKQFKKLDIISIDVI